MLLAAEVSEGEGDEREKMENGFSSEGENDDRGENITSETDSSEGQRSHLLRVNV